jgi:hypothetical protein
MKNLTQEQIKLIHDALSFYASVQENTIKEHFLDFDHEELVDASQKTSEKVSEILPYFDGTRIVYLMETQQ